MTTPRLDLECEIINRLSELHCHSTIIWREVIDQMLDRGMVLVVIRGRAFLMPKEQRLQPLFTVGS